MPELHIAPSEGPGFVARPTRRRGLVGNELAPSTLAGNRAQRVRELSVEQALQAHGRRGAPVQRELLAQPLETLSRTTKPRANGPHPGQLDAAQGVVSNPGAQALLGVLAMW